MQARAEGAPIEVEDRLPIERLRLGRLVEIDREHFLNAVAREVGLRRIVGQCGSGDQKKSERSRCDLHVYSDDSLCKIVTLSSKLTALSCGARRGLGRMKWTLTTPFAGSQADATSRNSRHRLLSH